MYFTTDSVGFPRLPVYKTVLCLTCVLILIANTFSLLHNLQSLRGASDMLDNTSRVGDRLQYLNVLVIDAESSMRGYFLSGKEAYLGPARAAPVQISEEFKELKDLLADSPAQLKNLAQLRTLVNRKLALMEQGMEVYQHGGLDEIVKIARLTDERAIMDEIRLLVVIMVKEQHEELNTRSAAFYQQYQKAVLLGVGINAVAIFVLLLFYRLVRRSFFTRVATQHALQNANETLESMVALRTGQLAVLSRHLINVSEKEKARLARELHDELGANLTAIGMDIAGVADKLKGGDPALSAMLARAHGTLLDTVELKRRLVEDLRPSLLDNLGLSAALHSYCGQFATISRLACDVLIDGEVDIAGPTHAIAVFRIVQESLNNIVKYAQARNVIVQLTRESDGLLLQVIDDGVGIAVDAMSTPSSHGLLGMRERALLLDGWLTVRRGVNEVGTCVEAWLPLRQETGAAGAAISSATHPSTDGHTPSSPPYSIPPHTAPDLAGR